MIFFSDAINAKSIVLFKQLRQPHKQQFMETNENETAKGSGTEFTNLQSDLDKAKNERSKDERKPGNKKDAEIIKTDVSQKKTGGGKQVSPGS
jgi:hypothetical protein